MSKINNNNLKNERTLTTIMLSPDEWKSFKDKCNNTAAAISTGKLLALFVKSFINDEVQLDYTPLKGFYIHSIEAKGEENND